MIKHVPQSRFWFNVIEALKDQHSIERLTEEMLRQLASHHLNDEEAYWILWTLFNQSIMHIAVMRWDSTYAHFNSAKHCMCLFLLSYFLISLCIWHATLLCAGNLYMKRLPWTGFSSKYSIWQLCKTVFVIVWLPFSFWKSACWLLLLTLFQNTWSFMFVLDQTILSLTNFILFFLNLLDKQRS